MNAISCILFPVRSRLIHSSNELLLFVLRSRYLLKPKRITLPLILRRKRSREPSRFKKRPLRRRLVCHGPPPLPNQEGLVLILPLQQIRIRIRIRRIQGCIERLTPLLLRRRLHRHRTSPFLPHFLSIILFFFTILFHDVILLRAFFPADAFILFIFHYFSEMPDFPFFSSVFFFQRFAPFVLRGKRGCNSSSCNAASKKKLPGRQVMSASGGISFAHLRCYRDMT